VRLSTIFAAILAFQASSEAFGQTADDRQLCIRLLQDDVKAAKAAIEQRGVVFDSAQSAAEEKPGPNSAMAGAAPIVSFLDGSHTIASVRWSPSAIPEFYLVPRGSRDTVVVGAYVMTAPNGSCEIILYTSTLPDISAVNRTYSCDAFMFEGRDAIQRMLQATISSVLPH
jgi:hypothetical protein